MPAGSPEDMPVQEKEVERPPWGVIMVEPTVEELQRWKGLWYPVPNARSGGVYENGVVSLAPFWWRQIRTVESGAIERGINEGGGFMGGHVRRPGNGVFDVRVRRGQVGCGGGCGGRLC